MIDRTHIKTVLKEHKLAATGLIDPTTAKKLGQIIGADALLTGSMIMTPFSENVRVTIKVLATDTAKIVAADSVDLPKTKTIAELQGTGLGQKEQMATLGPGDRDSSRAQINAAKTAVAAEFLYDMS